MSRRRFSAFRYFFRPVLGDRSGVAAVFLAVALVPLIGAVGLAVDSSLGYLLKTRMGKALDTAGLAAGRVALDANAEEVAQQFFDANFGSNPSVTVEPVHFELDGTLRFVTLTTTASTPTLFMRVFGRDTMSVSARSVIERETTGMELALILDNTGSMSEDNKFKHMQDAAYDLVDILYGSDEEIDNLWISIIPFVASVNIGSSRTDWIKATDKVHKDNSKDANNWGSPSKKWKGCVLARSYPLDVAETPPSGGLFSTYRWAEKSDRNYACGAPIQPLTASKTKVKAALSKMAAAPMAGGTTANLGLVWGWRTLSPLWRGLWGSDTPAELPLDYLTDRMTKVAVVLTDGQNQLVYDHYTAYGFPSDLGYKKTASSVAMLDGRMTEVCDAMKAEGITIYSIIFGPDPDADTQELFENCATTPAMYYYAPKNTDIAKAFRAIGGQLANLRIVE